MEPEKIKNKLLQKYERDVREHRTAKQYREDLKRKHPSLPEDEVKAIVLFFEKLFY